MTAVVTFSLADRDFALDVKAVREVIRMVAITPVPDAPPQVLGEILVHGVPTPVVDLRLRFGLPAEPPGPNAPLLLVEVEGGWLACLVDKVNSVVHIEGSADATGMIRIGDRLVALLTPERLPTHSATQQHSPLLTNA